jgi:ubiquinone/menaquinone biosynthesis C-methylase UbiE
MKDFATITELPGALLNQEQMARIVQRYQLGMQLARGRRVLEVSCGAGSGLGMLRQTAQTLVACDTTFSVLAMAQRHYGARAPLVCADAQQLPFASTVFDLVISFEAIYYLAQIDWFLCEARRLLVAGGQLLIVTSNPDWLYFAPGAMSIHYPSIPKLAPRLLAAGFQKCAWYGAMPTQLAGAQRRATMALLRKWVLQWLPINTEHLLIKRLKRLVYGSLFALPAELVAPENEEADICTTLTPLAGDAQDRMHRVLVAIASL